MAHQRLTQTIEVKNRFYKNMCQTKDPLKRQQLEDRVNKYKKNILKLIRKTKANHYNNFLQEKQIKLGRHTGNH